MLQKRTIMYLLSIVCCIAGWFQDAMPLHAEEQQIVTEKTFEYSGTVERYVVPVKGIYKLEVWGAQGGGADGSANARNDDRYLDGGKGGYSCGYTVLEQNEELFICVGGAGGCSYTRNDGAFVKGGYNGGGNYRSADNCMNAAGGGATSIAAMTGTIKQIGKSNLSQIYLIAGGGGGASNGDGAWCRTNGGDGGGTTGGIGRTNSWSSSPATQSTGYAFGEGVAAAGNSGSGGGGGLYGGSTASKASGGGGSGYIGGVPSFSYHDVVYAPNTTAGERYGNGLAKITLIEVMEYVSLTENNYTVIEKQTVSMVAEVRGMVSYTWQRQKKDSNLQPLSDAWMDIDSSEEKYTIVEEIAEGTGKISLSFIAESEDAEYWYRVKMNSHDSTYESSLCELYVIPLKKGRIEVRNYNPKVKLGDGISIDDFELYIVYNNEEIEEKLSEHPSWKSQIYFLIDGEKKEQVLFSQVSNNYQIVVHMEDEDQPEDFILEFIVEDCNEPQVEKVTIEDFSYEKNPCEKEFVIHILAHDDSQGPLEFWYIRESDGWESEHNHTGDFIISLENNDKIILWIQDESGNIKKWEQNMVFVDQEAPCIIEVLATPDKNWKEGNAEIRIIAQDELSGLHESAYSFDRGITWQKDEYIIIDDSKELVIRVRDKLGNESEDYPFKIVKEKKSNAAGSLKTDVAEIGEILLSDSDYLQSFQHSKGPDFPLPFSEKPLPDIERQNENDKIELIYPELESERLISIQDNVTPLDGYGIRRKKRLLTPLATTVAVTASTGATGFVFFFFWFIRKADVYYINQSREEEIISTGILRKRRNGYVLKLKESTFENHKEGKYFIKTSKKFVTSNRDKYLDIVMKKRNIQTISIHENMWFYWGKGTNEK